MKSVIKKSKGFTLTELLIVIGIFSILMMIAIPNFLTWKANYRFRNAINDLYSNLHRARFTAIRQRCLCTVTFHQPVPPSGGTVFDYVVFIDKNNNMELDQGEVDGILAKVKWSNYVNVDFGPQSNDGVNFSHNDDGLPAVAFRTNGLPRSNTGALPMGSVFIKNTYNDKIKSIKLARAGRIRIADN